MATDGGLDIIELLHPGFRDKVLFAGIQQVGERAAFARFSMQKPRQVRITSVIKAF